MLDPWLLSSVIVLPIMAVAILINPFDVSGSIDAFFYRAYALDFTDLVNRYGPYYYAYRIGHIGWAYLFEKLFGAELSYYIWKVAQFSAIGAIVWTILRPFTTARTTFALIAVLLTAPWLTRGVVTYFTNCSSLIYSFAIIALLAAINRRNFESASTSFLAGGAYALLVNTNSSLIVFGGLLFVGYYATGLKTDRFRLVVTSLALAMFGFFATQLAIFLVWSAVLASSGTPLSAIIGWTVTSLKATAWNADMFGLVVMKTNILLATTDPRPSLMALLRAGDVHVLAPLLILGAAGLFRLWAPHANSFASNESYRSAQRSFDPILVSAALVIGAGYISSESTGNIILKLPYYFVFILPITLVLSLTYVALAVQVVKAGCDDRTAGRESTWIFWIAALGPIVYLLFNLMPDTMTGLFTWRRSALALIALAGASAVAGAFPVTSPRFVGRFAGIAVVSSVLLFLSSSSGEYRIPFSRDNAAISKDVMNAQLDLLHFVKRHAPPPGVSPNGNLIINWHNNTNFADSLSANFLADNFTLQESHSGPGLPRLDDRAMAQLRYDRRWDLVLVYLDPQEGEAARKALRDTGVSFDVLEQAKYDGKVQSAYFDYLRITKPAPPG